jgi:maltose O-acetyltransferase
MLRHLVNLLLWVLPPSRMFAFRGACLRAAGVEVSRTAKVCGRGWIYGRGVFRVGEETWLSPGVVVYTHLGAAVTIGARCDIGPAVEFITGSHHMGPASRRAGTGTAASIVIGDGCWIGAGARILAGVSVGRGAVVAAGSVVTRSVDPDTLVAGVPATKKKALA